MVSVVATVVSVVVSELSVVISDVSEVFPSEHPLTRIDAASNPERITVPILRSAKNLFISVPRFPGYYAKNLLLILTFHPS